MPLKRRIPPTLLLGLLLALALPLPTLAAAEDTPKLIIDAGGHKAKIKDVLFTPDGKGLISVSDDKSIRIWDTASGELRRTLRGQMGEGHEGKLYAGALSADGRWLAVGGWLSGEPKSWDAIRLIDLQAPEDAPLRLLKGHGNVILGLAFSLGRKTKQGGNHLLLSGSGDFTARLWEVEPGAGQGRLRHVLRGHTEPIYAVAISPPDEDGPDKKDNRRLATASDDHTLRLWSEDGTLIKVLEGHTDKVRAAAFTPDGRYLVSGSDDKTLRLWDGRDGWFIKQLAEQDSRVGSLSISPDGKSVLTGPGSPLRL